jgi:transcriptional regulator with XRE-family HTH domain
MPGEVEHGSVAVRFGENLRRCRGAAGLTQEDVAYLTSLHRTEIGLLERGQRRARIDTVVRLAAALSVSPGELFKGIAWELPRLGEGRFKIVRPGDE